MRTERDGNVGKDGFSLVASGKEKSSVLLNADGTLVFLLDSLYLKPIPHSPDSLNILRLCGIKLNSSLESF